MAVEDIGRAVQLGPGEDAVGGEPPSATLAATSCSSQARWTSVKDVATSLSVSYMVVGSSLLDPRKCTVTGMLLAFLLQLRLEPRRYCYLHMRYFYPFNPAFLIDPYRPDPAGTSLH